MPEDQRDKNSKQDENRKRDEEGVAPLFPAEDPEAQEDAGKDIRETGEPEGGGNFA